MVFGIVVAVCATIVILYEIRKRKAAQSEAIKLKPQIDRLTLELQQKCDELNALTTTLRKLEKRFEPVVLLDEELKVLSDRIDEHEIQASDLEAKMKSLRFEHDALEELSVLSSFGFYKPRYAFATVEKYEQRLDVILEEQKAMLKEKRAAVCNVDWEVNGSKAEGRKQTNQLLKLMLRAFNGECDAAIAKVNYKNVKAMEARIEKSADTIEALVSVQKCTLTKRYIALKLDELHLAFEYEERVQADRVEQKQLREQMRDEEVARRELEKAKLEVEREERRFTEALEKARSEVLGAEGAKQDRLAAKIAELEQMLAATREKERAISQAQLTRTGHVYVISNIGSFGENVYKIGMTRRLVPQDRIDELGDASVPFEFDVHAIIRAEDAPALENSKRSGT